MIKALIVDDEYLIRKGLILTLPWEKYDISIIGEADCAQNAIEFISKNKVDLLLTDITMPDMSGFDLIHEVSMRHPEIFVAVITCHRDFDLIQNALRLGAIDYIVKTELDDNVLSENLRRISEHVKTGIKSRKIIDMHDFNSFENLNYGLLLASRHYKYEIKEITALNFISNEMFIDMGGGNLLYIIKYENLEKCIQYINSGHISQQWILIGIRNINEINKTKLNDLVCQYITNDLIYCNISNPFLEIDAVECKDIIKVPADDKYSMLKKEWYNILWVFNDDEFKRIKAYTVSLQPDASRLKSIFNGIMSLWNLSPLMDIFHSFSEQLAEAKFWIDYDLWANDFRKFVSKIINTSSYPDETVTAVLNALNYINMNYTKDINQKDISKMFNLSRSYFSKAFKDIFGVNYIEHIRNMRLEKAKDLLLQTNSPIYQISNEVGFVDEKYFSRIFKENTGQNPVEFRSTKKDTIDIK